MITYQHPETKDTQQIKFPLMWILTPLCSLDLLLKGKVLHALVGWMPIFTFIFSLQYKSILSDVWEKKGYKRV